MTGGKAQHDAREGDNGWLSPRLRGLVGLVTVLTAWYVYKSYGEYLTFTSLKANREEVLAFVKKWPNAAPALYLMFFVVVVGLSIPGATVLSFAGGLFFKQPWATIYSWIGCTIGATLCFCLVRSVIGDFLRRKVSTKSGVFRRFKAGLERNHILYMIFIRYVLVVPFWFVNVAAAVLGVPLGVFMFTTCVAIVPGSLLYTTAGSGLAAIFDDYDPVNMPTSAILWRAVLNEDMKVCLGLLVLCLLVPIGIKLYQTRTNS